jgi:hypothetical protein
VDEEGTLVFRDDVYGRDEPLLRLFVGELTAKRRNPGQTDQNPEQH